jgi:hypothetical protein
VHLGWATRRSRPELVRAAREPVDELRRLDTLLNSAFCSACGSSLILASTASHEATTMRGSTFPRRSRAHAALGRACPYGKTACAIATTNATKRRLAIPNSLALS